MMSGLRSSASITQTNILETRSIAAVSTYSNHENSNNDLITNLL